MENYFDKFTDFAQRQRMKIQEKFGSSGDLISTSELNSFTRKLGFSSDSDSKSDGSEDSFEDTAKKFFYTSPMDFFKNHKNNIDELVDKHIMKTIDKISNFGD